MKKLLTYISLICVLAIAFSAVALAAVTPGADATEVAVGDTVTITVTAGSDLSAPGLIGLHYELAFEEAYFKLVEITGFDADAVAKDGKLPLLLWIDNQELTLGEVLGTITFEAVETTPFRVPFTVSFVDATVMNGAPTSYDNALLEVEEPHVRVSVIEAPEAHVHSFETRFDETGHWEECVCSEKTTVKEHRYATNNCASEAGCLDCDYVKPAGQHIFGTWSIEKNANCATGETGLRKRTCKACGTPDWEVIPADHDYREYGSVPASCTTNGHTAGVKCAKCGDILSGYQVIKATGHKPKDVDAKEPTCTIPGHEAGTRCAVCDVRLTGLKIINAGHDIEEVAAKDAICSEPGHTAGTRCKRCGEILSGMETLTAGHTEETVAEKAATCTEDGHTAGTRCAVCGEILSGMTVLPAGHKIETVEAKAATCTEDGHTAGSRCTVCGTVIGGLEVIPAGHKLEKIPGKEATCLEAGVKDSYKCTVCGKIFSDVEGKNEVTSDAELVIAALGHKDLNEDGDCDVCGEKLGGGSGLLWLWITIGVLVVVGAAIPLYFFVIKKKLPKKGA